MKLLIKFLVIILLSGCGVKGPLYQPEEQLAKSSKITTEQTEKEQEK